MLTFIGLAIIVVIVYLLLTEKMSPMVSLILVPIVGALVAGFSFEDITKFFTSGVDQVIQVVIMFIFAILFFGIMNDVGLFDPVIGAMVKISRGNVIAVSVGTVLVASIAQLDGAGASTFLLVVPALLPLYQRLQMSPYLLFLLITASTGIVNMLPWGGPVGRVASVLDKDAVDVWRPLIPVQIVGLVFAMILAVILGIREKRRIAKRVNTSEDTQPSFVEGSQTTNDDLKRPKLYVVNIILIVAVLVALFSGILPSGYVFMIGASIALVINYPKPTEQMARIKAHAPGAMMMAGIILGAGTFLGILDKSGMLTAMARDLVSILPHTALSYVHILIGIVGVPLELLLSTDAYYYALFPIVEKITSNVGVSQTASANAVIIGSIVGTFVSPFAPALWLGLGLGNLSMGKHIKYSFFWIWGLALAVFIVSYFMGVF